MDENKQKMIKRRGVMDFTPTRRSTPKTVTPRMSEAERARREAARVQVSRREEIHRQIEAQNEADIIAKRRAEAARRELARQRAVEEEAERARAEKEAEREEALRIKRHQEHEQEKLERQVAEERRKMVAKRRAEAARKELARRQAADASMKRAAVRPVKNPVGSVDPIARKVTVKLDEVNHRVYGEVTPGKAPMTRAEKEFRALHPETLGDVSEFAEEIEDFDEEVTKVQEILEIEEEKKPEEDTSANNYSYILGGRSPFINTEQIVKRPLSGNNAGIGADKLQRPGAKLEKKKLLGGPNRGDYVSPAEGPRPRTMTKAPGKMVPYEEPIPHKNLYARRVEATKKQKTFVPTMVVAEEEKGSGLALALIVLITVILGAAVGVITYLAFFQ